MSTAALQFHMPAHMAAPDGSRLPEFYRKLCAGFTARGAEVRILHRDLAALARPRQSQDFDFVHNGRIARDGLLNTGLGYLYPFWYMDPQGIFADSALADARFDPAAQPAAEAEAFAKRLYQRYAAARKSRYTQPEEVTEIPAGCIAVFLQDLSDPVERARHMDAKAMLKAVLADTGGRRVVVKPHPRNQGPETYRLVRWLGKHHPQVLVSGANVHDILARAALSVSISSAVSLEGMIHRVPSVLFGRSDFHHNACTVVVPGDWPAARDRALGGEWPHAAFLWWFLHEQMIRSGSDDMMDVVLARMAARGADLALLRLI
ncbi:hypothetical protein [Phaeovulum sp. W22_SRMD_FR3]|uniref:hypothetical protein n=1 Tax=Phaeovulum sp. W22_SRMD_FR3 TaxID=3240274 RepID=UPI003F9A7D60